MFHNYLELPIWFCLVWYYGIVWGVYILFGSVIYLGRYGKVMFFVEKTCLGTIRIWYICSYWNTLITREDKPINDNWVNIQSASTRAWPISSPTGETFLDPHFESSWPTDTKFSLSQKVQNIVTYLWYNCDVYYIYMYIYIYVYTHAKKNWII